MNEDINVEHHLGLAKKIAWYYAVTSRIPFDELVGESYLALVMAKEGYDPEKEAKFSTYAYSAITNHLNGYMNKIRDIRSVEIQMEYLMEYESGKEDLEIHNDGIPNFVKDTWTSDWFNSKNWNDILTGIEKDIYNLVCKQGYYLLGWRNTDSSISITAKLKEMGYTFQEIAKGFRSMRDRFGWGRRNGAVYGT